MKKFNFRLQRVLDYRNSLKKEKERELALRNSELREAEERLQTILAAQDAVPPEDEHEMIMAELGLKCDYLYYLQESLVNQRDLVAEAAHAVDLAREAYIEKAVESETLETLKKKKKEEYTTERRRSERKEADKMTVQRFRFKVGGVKGDDNG